MKNADTIVKKNISELISYRALQHPDAVAMIFGGRQITYSELNRQANHLAHEICSVTGESKLIGISTTRSIETIIGIVAILKSGKAYLPLDSSHPEDRLQQIISDAGLAYCLADAEESPLFKQLGVKSLNYKQPPTVSEIPEINVAGSLIYVLYTSGSTGAPKGVMMGQEALLNLLNWQRAHSMATEASRTLQFAPLTFDVSFQEIFATLTTGGTLILIEDDLRLDSHELLTFIDRQGINRLFLPFVALQMLTDTATASDLYPGCLKEVATAGEQLKITPQVVNFFSRIPGASLYNQYGPTESHVVTALKLDGAPSSWPTLPTIGHPIWDTDIYILDEELNLLREGEIGELCISGVCLAEGYLNREDLTAEKIHDVATS